MYVDGSECKFIEVGAGRRVISTSVDNICLFRRISIEKDFKISRKLGSMEATIETNGQNTLPWKLPWTEFEASMEE